MIPILHDLFQKIEAVGILPSLFHEARITLILELDKDNTRNTRNENYRPMSLMNID